MAEWFSVAALFIMFREALEAAVIISVLLQMLVKLKMQHLKKWVWFGALSGLILSFIAGIIFVVTFYVADTKLFSDKVSLIFKGCICWTACLLITSVSFSMLRFYNMERRWRHKLEDAMSAQKQKEHRSVQWSMFTLAGTATLREGIESVLFLTGVSAGSSIKAVIIPGAVGVLLGAVLGVAIYYTGRTISSLKWFFIASSFLLLFIAAGMVVNGTAFFQYALLFGTMWPYEWRPWSNQLLWDASSCCDPNTNEFWAVMRALFGWQGEALNLQMLYYCMFWVLTIGLLSWKAYNGTLTDRKEAAMAQAKSFAARGKLGEVELSEEGGKGKVAGSDDDSAADLELGDAVNTGSMARTSPGDSVNSIQNVDDVALEPVVPMKA